MLASRYLLDDAYSRSAARDNGSNPGFVVLVAHVQPFVFACVGGVLVGWFLFHARVVTAATGELSMSAMRGWQPMRGEAMRDLRVVVPWR
jgi:hypothetical protein